jgi:hypothetical protein
MFVVLGCLCLLVFHRNKFPKTFSKMNLTRLFYSYAYCEEERFATNYMLEFVTLQNCKLWPEKRCHISYLIIVDV